MRQIFRGTHPAEVEAGFLIAQGKSTTYPPLGTRPGIFSRRSNRWGLTANHKPRPGSLLFWGRVLPKPFWMAQKDGPFGPFAQEGLGAGFF